MGLKHVSGPSGSAHGGGAPSHFIMITIGIHRETIILWCTFQGTQPWTNSGEAPRSKHWVHGFQWWKDLFRPSGFHVWLCCMQCTLSNGYFMPFLSWIFEDTVASPMVAHQDFTNPECIHSNTHGQSTTTRIISSEMVPLSHLVPMRRNIKGCQPSNMFCFYSVISLAQGNDSP